MVLTEKGLGDAVQEYIEKDERDAIGELINYQIDKMQVSWICYLIWDWPTFNDLKKKHKRNTLKTKRTGRTSINCTTR